jgi:Predicted transcriptional regulators
VIITIDFNSEEAIYIQLRNQIIIGIANSQIREGDNLPSVRELAENIGINMHTVNKAYTILKQEGYLKLDRRKGAVIAIDVDHYEALMEMADELRVILAKGICRNISREEVHELIDSIYSEFSSIPCKKLEAEDENNMD